VINLQKVLAKDVMSRRVVTLNASMSLREALETLSEERITGAPVVDEDNNPVGVISINDIAGYEVGKIRKKEAKRALYYSVADYPDSEEYPELDDEDLPEEILDKATVANAMTPMTITVSPESSLEQVCRVMTKERIHRVLVTEAFKVIGLVSSMDILKAIANPPKQLER
jgi:CBS domain-containing protein